MQEGASRPAHFREARFGMGEANARRSFATCPPPAQPQTGMAEGNPPSITIFCFVDAPPVTTSGALRFHPDAKRGYENPCAARCL
jgi:hypothetical protein